jgi:hypothetical protein
MMLAVKAAADGPSGGDGAEFDDRLGVDHRHVDRPAIRSMALAL